MLLSIAPSVSAAELPHLCHDEGEESGVWLIELGRAGLTLNVATTHECFLSAHQTINTIVQAVVMASMPPLAAC